jgi:hypothetical protein
MLSIRHGGTKLLLGDLEVEACKAYVLAWRERIFIFQRGQQPPLVEQILYSAPWRIAEVQRELASCPQRIIGDPLLWLPKYGRLATFADSYLELLNSRNQPYLDNTIGLRAEQTPMHRRFAIAFTSLKPFEVYRCGGRDPYRKAVAAWSDAQEYDYAPLENALKQAKLSDYPRLFYPIP